MWSVFISDENWCCEVSSVACNAFFLGKIIPFPKLIRNLFRISVTGEQILKDELGFLTQLGHAFILMAEPN